MYSVGGQDSVVELTDVPPMEAGAPTPNIFATEHTVEIAYRVRSEPRNPGPEQIAYVEFARPRAHYFGSPNDETLSGHPLAKRGLGPYAAWEVRDSSWIQELVRMNSVHPRHSAAAFRDLRHFIFVFHDSTFECIARSYTCRIASQWLQWTT
jgi:hypothetical protein